MRSLISWLMSKVKWIVGIVAMAGAIAIVVILVVWAFGRFGDEETTLVTRELTIAEPTAQPTTEVTPEATPEVTPKAEVTEIVIVPVPDFAKKATVADPVFPTRLHILAKAKAAKKMDSLLDSRTPAFWYRTQKSADDPDKARVETVGAKCPEGARGQALGTNHWMCYMSTTEAQKWLSSRELQFDRTPRMVFPNETKPIEKVNLDEPGFRFAFQLQPSVSFPVDFSVDVIPGSENPQCPTEKFPSMEGDTGYTCVLTSPEELAGLVQNWGWEERLEDLQTNTFHGVFSGEDLEYTGEWPPARR